MMQTGFRRKISSDEEELEYQKEKLQMIRPALDYSAASITKTETLSMVQELRLKDVKNLPITDLRPMYQNPNLSHVNVDTKAMRGITDKVGAELNSIPGEERIIEVFDDATIKTSQASTAKIRRASNYAPTDDKSDVTISETTPIPAIAETVTSSEQEIFSTPSTPSTESTFHPVKRPEFMEKELPTEDLELEPEMQIERTSGTFNGVYFPCFGIFAAPLFGTEIFPLPPRQERYHYQLVMGKPTDHLDGNPNSGYEDEIRKYMAKVIKAYNQNGLRFTDQMPLTERLDNWRKKFPFSTTRWGETVTAFRPISEVEYFRTVENNPDMLTEESDIPIKKLGNCSTRRTVSGTQNPPQPIKYKERYVEKKQKLEADKLKVFLGESDFRQSKTLLAYQNFNEVVKHFKENGYTFPWLLSRFLYLLNISNSFSEYI